MSETARKKKAKSNFHGGLESTLDLTGFIIQLVGILAGVGTLIFAGAAGILPALVQVGGAWLCRLVLRAFAESIRLQKRAQGLPYDGRISEPKEEVIYACSECGAMLHSDKRCESCGRTLVEEST